MAQEVDKVTLNRLRRVAARQGLKIVKSRRRDPRALDYGRYWLLDRNGGPVAGGEQGLDLDQLCGTLGEPRR